MPRTLLFLLCASLLGCPPVRSDDDDATSGDDDDATGDLQSVYDGLSEGACDVIPDNDALLPTGAGQATMGLWYEVRCIWTGGNASSVTLNLDYFDGAGGDFPITSVYAVDVGGNEVRMEGDLGALHLIEGEPEYLNGWWEGDLAGVDPAGQPVQLDAIVFRGAVVDTVVGR